MTDPENLSVTWSFMGNQWSGQLLGLGHDGQTASISRLGKVEG